MARPQDPCTFEEIEAKFLRLAGQVKVPAAVERIRAAARELASSPGVDAFSRALREATSPMPHPGRALHRPHERRDAHGPQCPDDDAEVVAPRRRSRLRTRMHSRTGFCAELPDETRAAHRAVRGRRRHGHSRANARAEALRRLVAQRRRGQPPWRRQRDRLGARRPGHAGRIHAAAHGEPAHEQSGSRLEAPLRHRARLLRGHAARIGAAVPGRASVSAGAFRHRARLVREVAAESSELRKLR